MKAIFARQGIPEVVISDNGPQFNSRDFVKFSETYGFTHLTSSPLHPQGNGEAERAVQTVKKLPKKAYDPYVALLNYRATLLQHGSSPAELLMVRKLRTKVTIRPTQHVPEGRDITS
ncbi:integrase catalytic domain-containing protein [Thiolapillus sp.]|uniref:integrase catalytic domain-containing protein n=1 Tax=Thiolapillus sp. TaxID=2017437 RepID=UPI003AF674E2